MKKFNVYSFWNGFLKTGNWKQKAENRKPKQETEN